jgi:predicted MPP superfamily phosphohydrolase
MSMINGLKLYLYNKKVRQSLASSTVRTATNLSRAINIGILFDATNEKDAKTVLNYTKELKRLGKKVILMAYKDCKVLEGNEAFPCFCNSDLAWSHTPKSAQALDFIARKFDLLLSLHTHESLPLEYMATASSASFRVGHYQEGKTHCYDLMVYGKSKSLRVFIIQMEAYIKKIN